MDIPMKVNNKRKVLDFTLLFAGVFYLALALWPAAFWYKAGSTVFPDAVEGEVVQLEYNGGPRREFIGSYSVLGRDFSTREVVCEARSSRFPYEPDSKRPDPLDMEWWAKSDPRCHSFSSGTYSISTCWTIHGLFWGLVPDKTLCTSSILKVGPKK